MTACPVAIVAGWKKCPAFAMCPLKGVIVDYDQTDKAQTTQAADPAQGGAHRDG